MFTTARVGSCCAILLQVCDLPSTTPMSRLAYWQSEALSRDLLSARAGSQSQLSARKLVSCPSLLAAALVSDPAVVLEPIIKPPAKSEVTDWLKSNGQPIDAKYAASRSAAANLPPSDYGPPITSKLAAMPNSNTELMSTTATDIESQQRLTLRSEKQDFDVDHEKKDEDGKTSNVDDDRHDKVGRKKSLFEKRQCHVSFWAESKVSSAELVTDENANSSDGKPVTDKNCLPAAAAADDDDDDNGNDGGLHQLTDGKSPVSDSSSILLCSQLSSNGHRLPKASFIDLEVPESWRPCRQSQAGDSSQHSSLPHGSASSSSSREQHVVTTPTVYSWRGHQESHVSGSSPQHSCLPPAPITSSSAVRPHVATTNVASRWQGNELVDLSVISCSPITPRTTFDQMARTRPDERRTHSSGVIGDQKDHDDVDDDDVVVIPCSPLTPTPTSAQPHCMKNQRTDEDEDEDVTVIPCTPVSPTSSQLVKTGSWDERLSTGVEDHQDHEVVEDEKLAVVSCGPVTPTTTVSNHAAQNKLQQRFSQRASRLKVVLTSFHRVCLL